MMALAMLVGSWIAYKMLKSRGLNGDVVYDGLIYYVIAGIIGARLVYVVTNWSEFSKNLAEIVRIDHGGLSFHGGIIFGVIACWLYFRKRRDVTFMQAMDSMAPGVAAGIILVRIGNFLNGDILGYKSRLPWAMNFPYDEYHTATTRSEIFLRHPTEIYGLLVGVILLPMMLNFYRRKPWDGYLFWAFIGWYSFIRSVIEEPFRSVPIYLPVYANVNLGVGMLTLTQIVSIPLILLSIYMIARHNTLATRGERPPTPAKPAAKKRRPRGLKRSTPA
jgi:phosphatidylglycerol:prolipoprotein diacylglycerol transferase